MTETIPVEPAMTETTPVKPAKRIKVKGDVLIGTRLDASLQHHRQPRFDPTPGPRPYRGPRAKHIVPHSAGASDPVAFVRRELRPTLDKVVIRDDGLTTCHGIFGNPGMGKSHLMMRLLEAVLKLPLGPEERFGGLILDPKGTLAEDVVEAAERANRLVDVQIVSTAELEATLSPHRVQAGRTGGMNVLDAPLSETEIAVSLVLAAQSATKSASDPYWANAWKNIFMGVAELLPVTGRKVTLANLVDATIRENPATGLSLPSLLHRAKDKARDLSAYERADILGAVDRVSTHRKQKGETAATINVLVATALGEFQRSKYRACYSSAEPDAKYVNMYDQITNDGKIYVVSLTKGEQAFAGILVTLVKTLFQRTLLGRYERSRNGEGINFQRPVLLMCDEYQEVATELAGQAVGDASFFQQSRQVGCMGLLATQSVSGMIHTLPGEGAEAAWNAIMATFGSMTFFQSSDPQTRAQAVAMAGEADAHVVSTGASYGSESPTFSINRALETRNLVQESQIAQLTRGQALVVGSLDNLTPTCNFVKVPSPGAGPS